MTNPLLYDIITISIKGGFIINKINILIPKICFPDYNKMKELKKDKEYIFSLFELGTNNIYGRFTLYEDFTNLIRFDLIINGYSGENSWEVSYKFNKDNYKKICNYAQDCYNYLFSQLYYSSQSTWHWDFYFNGEFKE